MTMFYLMAESKFVFRSIFTAAYTLDTVSFTFDSSFYYNLAEIRDQ